ncbi:MAG: response regulator transcription factor [Nocardioidaceae bacterium]
MARILVVEDEIRLASAVARGLTDRGFEVSVTHDGYQGYRLAKEHQPDVIVLDLMLPTMSGEEICRRLRREELWTPILILTAKDRDADETDLLNMGADDYLRKPFSFSVLVARCRALVRRGPVHQPAELAVGDLFLDPGRRTARRGDTPIELSRREFALLEYLMRNSGQVRSKEDILQEVWGRAASMDANLVEVYIGYLRRKVDQPFQTHTVNTVRGRGYRLEQQS